MDYPACNSNSRWNLSSFEVTESQSFLSQKEDWKVHVRYSRLLFTDSWSFTSGFDIIRESIAETIVQVADSCLSDSCKKEETAA